MENFSNLKSQCYYYLADRINARKLAVKTSDPKIRNALIEELEVVQIKDLDKDGRVTILPKDKVKELIGRSPDYSDALMMREWFGLKFTNSGWGIRATLIPRNNNKYYQP